MAETRGVTHGTALAGTRLQGQAGLYAGGIPYAGGCTATKKDGSPCGANGSEDGLCAGHRKQARLAVV